MKIKKSSIDDLFRARIEELAILTNDEVRILLKIKNKNQGFIEDSIDGLNEKQKTQAGKFFDDAVSDIFEETALYNQKYYAYGFSDGLNAAVHSFKLREEVERRFLK